MIKKSLLLCLYCCVILMVYSNGLCARQIEHNTDTNAPTYLIDFSGFSAKQLSEIDNFFRQFSGYQTHTVLDRQSSTFSIKYRSSASIELISYNFSKTFEHLGYEVLIRSTSEKMSFHFIKLKPNSIPYRQW